MVRCDSARPEEAASSWGCGIAVVEHIPSLLFHCRCGPKALVWVSRGYQVGMSLPQTCGVPQGAGGPFSCPAVPVSFAA